MLLFHKLENVTIFSLFCFIDLFSFLLYHRFWWNVFFWGVWIFFKLVSFPCFPLLFSVIVLLVLVKAIFYDYPFIFLLFSFFLFYSFFLCSFLPFIYLIFSLGFPFLWDNLCITCHLYYIKNIEHSNTYTHTQRRTK